jgi:membrane protein
MAGIADRVDRFQRKHPVVGFPLAVIYKFSDDQGNYLAAVITYYGFVSIFPLLLIASSILGFILQGNPKLEQDILNSALSQFPIVGQQLGRPGGLRGSTSAVVIGAVTALYGVLGLGQASQNAMNATWAVPRSSRPNPFLGRLRSFILLALAGLALLFVAVVTSLGSHVDVFGPHFAKGLSWLFNIGAVLLNAVVLTGLFRLATAHKLSLRASAPGALAVAVMWQGLQFLGATYVRHVVTRASDMNGVFALVLGLLGLIYIAAIMAVLGGEINVVLSKRLYPRSLLTPFTDNVELTAADRRAYSDYAKAMRYKGFQRVRVSFLRDPNTRSDQDGDDAGHGRP